MHRSVWKDTSSQLSVVMIGKRLGSASGKKVRSFECVCVYYIYIYIMFMYTYTYIHITGYDRIGSNMI